MLHGRHDWNRRIVDLDGEIPVDEPVFLIRGRDPAAVETIHFYAQKIGMLGGDRRVLMRACDQADAIEAYQRTHGTRMPD